MHMGVSDSATTVTNFVGATSGFTLIGAFLSDSYITRSRTILLFGPLEFLVIFSHGFSNQLQLTKITCMF
jgi:solute carrier family 15 (peptide/histidine transporter), member 3/4